MQQVEFMFDYASPWSHIANELLARELPGASIVFRPVYLRALESFRDGFPFAAAKTQYIAVDIARCAAHQGVEIKPPAAFPIHGLYALRGALLAQKLGRFVDYHAAMFRAAWVESREVSSFASVAGIARELGMPEIAGALEDPAVKLELRTLTENAAQRGAFGVPTFFVGEDMFWGHDRMDYVRRALA
jgi:2-hydroxychromene-2-carboxylate isomerase